MIHLRRVPIGVCEGRDKHTTELVAERERMFYGGLSGVVETENTIADYSGNVTCNRCKQWLKASKQRRLKMENQGIC